MKAAAILLALAAQASAVELTKETWDGAVAGKSVFVKFQAPWWGHCKKMKPDWEKLTAEFKDSKNVLIADVDCTAGGKSLCEQVGVRGYPTIKFGDPNNLEDYKGGRDLASLKKHAEENLGPTCGPANPELCDAEKKKMLDEFMAMSGADLQKKVQEQDEEMAAADKEVEDILKGLQAEYEEGSKKKEATETAIKDSGLGMMKAVYAHKKSKDEL